MKKINKIVYLLTMILCIGSHAQAVAPLDNVHGENTQTYVWERLQNFIRTLPQAGSVALVNALNAVTNLFTTFTQLFTGTPQQPTAPEEATAGMGRAAKGTGGGTSMLPGSQPPLQPPQIPSRQQQAHLIPPTNPLQPHAPQHAAPTTEQLPQQAQQQTPPTGTTQTEAPPSTTIKFENCQLPKDMDKSKAEEIFARVIHVLQNTGDPLRSMVIYHIGLIANAPNEEKRKGAIQGAVIDLCVEQNNPTIKDEAKQAVKEFRKAVFPENYTPNKADEAVLQTIVYCILDQIATPSTRTPKTPPTDPINVHVTAQKIKALSHALQLEKLAGDASALYKKLSKLQKYPTAAQRDKWAELMESLDTKKDVLQNVRDQFKAIQKDKLLQPECRDELAKAIKNIDTFFLNTGRCEGFFKIHLENPGKKQHSEGKEEK